jgi:SAM-dependent methyltransferase
MDGKRGPDFFDDPTVFEIYLARRTDAGSANETLERPVMDELIGDLKGLKILDLGCGDGQIGFDALKKGSRKYVGVEGSKNMARLARNTLNDTEAIIHHELIEDWDFPEAEFDLVISRLALHYLENLRDVFARVYHTLLPGGRFIFSVEHPVITSSDQARQAGGLRQAWIVDDYFVTGERQTHWMGAEVIKYHHTIEDYFMGLRSAGFMINEVRESRPQKGIFRNEETYRRRLRIPLMLFFLALRPGEQ